MLTKIEIRTYRVFQSFALEFNAGMSILVGDKLPLLAERGERDLRRPREAGAEPVEGGEVGTASFVSDQEPNRTNVRLTRDKPSSCSDVRDVRMQRPPSY